MDERHARDGTAAATQDCGCAPTAAERDSLWGKSITRRSAFGLGALGVVAFAAFGVTSGVSAAYAASYPSWDDVQRAKNNEAAKASEVTRIEGLIQSLTQKVTETEAAAKTASDEFFSAQQEYFEAITEAESLQVQADEQAKIADESARQAGQVAAQLYRNGATTLPLSSSSPAPALTPMISCLGWGRWRSSSSTTSRSTTKLPHHATPPSPCRIKRRWRVTNVTVFNRSLNRRWKRPKRRRRQRSSRSMSRPLTLTR